MIACVLLAIAAALITLGAWPRCPDCGGLADLFEGRCIPCFRRRLREGAE